MKDLNNAIWDMRLKLRYMSKELFDEVVSELAEERNYHDELISAKDVNFDFAVDFSNDRSIVGDHFVYAYVTESGKLFYIGQGDINRVRNQFNRKPSFEAVRKSEKCFPYVIASFANQEVSLLLETLCIETACLAGCSLLNIRKTIDLKAAIAKALSKSDYEWSDVQSAMFELIRYCTEMKKEAV